MAIEVEIKLKIEDSGELIKKLKTEHFTTGKTVWESGVSTVRTGYLPSLRW